MKKNEAISILQDIQNSLMNKNWKEKSLKTIETYIKGLEVATSKKIKNLIDKHCKYINKYGENHIKTKMLSKKINIEMQKIYNKKIWYIKNNLLFYKI